MPADDNFDCPTCHDTGYICADCDEADGECECDDGPELIDCPTCNE